jgi:hypothetical protein
MWRQVRVVVGGPGPTRPGLLRTRKGTALFSGAGEAHERTSRTSGGCMASRVAYMLRGSDGDIGLCFAGD